MEVPRVPIDDRIELSLVIPAYNEEETIEECVREADGVLARLGKRYEIVVVDDGSTDGTFARLRTLKAGTPSLRAVRYHPNKGQTAAMAAGFDRARGDIVVTMDADMQNDPADIPRLLDQMNEWDVVCGVRANRQDNFVRKASSAIANSVRNWLTDEEIHDVGCTLRAYRASYLRRVKLFEGMHRFLPTLLRLERARIVEVPVRHRPRLRGRNKYGIGNRLFKGLRDLWAVRWMQARYIRYEIEEEIT
jgi:dolichol-phosphate mannosyltransferase